MNRRALSVCTIVCGYAPNDYAPSRILGACWVQSVLVSIFLGRGTCLWQSCHFWHRERRLHHASQLCTTVFLKCTTISVNAPSFLPKCTTKMRNAPSFFWNAPRQTGKCNLVFSFYQNSRTKPHWYTGYDTIACVLFCVSTRENPWYKGKARQVGANLHLPASHFWFFRFLHSGWKPQICTHPLHFLAFLKIRQKVQIWPQA